MTVAVVRKVHLAQRIVESRPTEDPVIRVASSSSQPRSTSISCDVVGRPVVEVNLLRFLPSGSSFNLIDWGCFSSHAPGVILRNQAASPSARMKQVRDVARVSSERVRRATWIGTTTPCSKPSVPSGGGNTPYKAAKRVSLVDPCAMSTCYGLHLGVKRLQQRQRQRGPVYLCSVCSRT